MASFTNTNDHTIIPFNAPAHLPTKLTQTNFTVWRRQLQTALISYDLLGYIDGTITAPAKALSNKSPNPAYSQWLRQDQLILNAMLGSYIDIIQTHISTVSSSMEAWERLVTIFANKSRSHVMPLKEKLIHNPHGSRTVSDSRYAYHKQ